MNRKTPKVLLIHMPWATPQRPSISLGIIAALCAEKCIEVKTLYPNLDMANMIGFEAADRFANERSLYGISEHLFAVDIFGKEELISDAFVQSFSEIAQEDTQIQKWENCPIEDPAYFFHLRDEIIPQFLDQVTARVLEMNPTVVGFSATFNQAMASLALASRLKKLRPDLKVIVGGASFDGEMGKEYHRAFPHVLDHVFLGEAEESFREYLERLARNEGTTGIPGVTSWVNDQIDLVPGRPLPDMNQSPLPDYDDFFLETERIKKKTGKAFSVDSLSYEGSRGCWWGRKSQCLFCGINPETMEFRSKSIDRILRDIVNLSARYRVTKLSATDLVISRQHCDELFQRLKELDLDFELFYEVRVNMSKRQIKDMKEAGVIYTQPGIESFSSPVLKLMRKGTTALQNIQFLRWAAEIGVTATYNILAGFPGEKEEWYHEMADLIKKIVHLPPPKYNIHFIEMHRFSPFFNQREQYGVDECSLRADYQMTFPDGLLDPMKIGYFFQTQYKNKDQDSPHIKRVREEIDRWLDYKKSPQGLPLYNYSIGPGFLKIFDNRYGDGRFIFLADLHHDVALLCDEIQSRQSLKNYLAEKWPVETENGTLDQVIDELVQRDILLEENKQLLLLPVGVKYRDSIELKNYVF
ncbi:MAG: RiPP maturation radical SAM C-methyltransferase [Bacillota bacterium]|jgi:ribosomal peptide maturation radical SAM protein 1